MPRQAAGHVQEDLLSAIFDSAAFGISIRDLRGRYVRANPAFQAMTGFTQSELCEESDQALTHPEDLSKNVVLLQELLAGGRESFVMVKRYRTKSATAIWVRNTVSLLHSDSDTPSYIVALSENITESRKTQEVLRESDERFRLLVESVTDYAIFMLDLDGRVVSWNAGAERIKGYRAQEIIGEHFSRFYPREDVERGKPSWELEVAAAQGRFEDEGWRLRKDGSAFWANVIITPICDHVGTLRGYAKITRDLTERRQLEANLSESKARLQAFLDHSPAVMFMKDHDGRYQHANAQFQRLFGLSEHQILGKTDDEIFAPAQAAAFRVNDRNVLTRGVPVEFEETAQYVDGPRISMVCKFPVYDAAGLPASIGGFAFDITESKRAQDALKASERMFRELVDVLPTAVYACDATGLVESFNRSAVELWGRTPRLGESAELYCGSHRIYTPEGVYLPHAQCPMSEALRTGRPVTDQEIIIERPDGVRRTAMVSIVPRRDESGTLIGAINCLTDITERKRAEQELKEYADQLQALLRRKVDVQEEYQLALSRELHDRVGQNLTALNINLDIVLSQLPTEIRAELAPRLKDSQALVRATVDSITDVMADLRPPMLDDFGLLPALRSIGERFARRTGIGVTVRGAEHQGRLPHRAEITLCRIAQEALTNLAKHARATHVDIEFTRCAGRVTLAVADDGVGLDLHRGARERGRTGWGMLIMRERAQAVGGTLAIESAPGRGTRIIVTLEE